MKIKADIILMYIFELQNIHLITWHTLRKNGVPKDTIIDPINTEIKLIIIKLIQKIIWMKYLRIIFFYCYNFSSKI